ncbi:MAG: PIG-L family deacetylase [Spirochaetota bacterium]
MRIACIGAHPNDVELSMGGTVKQMLEVGHEVVLIDLSDGEPSTSSSPGIRKAESKKAASTLGVERIQLGIAKRHIEDTIANKKRLAAVFREIRCQYIFTHYEFDSHPDHSATCKITEAARFYAKLAKSDIEGKPYYPSQILYYFPSHIKINLKPSFCVDISSHIDTKQATLSAYESQFLQKDAGKFLEEILLLNSFYGLSINRNYAEPFFIREPLDIISLAKLFHKPVNLHTTSG